MNTADFDFDLPEELIAQVPLKSATALNYRSSTAKNGAWLTVTLTISSTS